MVACRYFLYLALVLYWMWLIECNIFTSNYGGIDYHWYANVGEVIWLRYCCYMAFSHHALCVFHFLSLKNRLFFLLLTSGDIETNPCPPM